MAQDRAGERQRNTGNGDHRFPVTAQECRDESINGNQDDGDQYGQGFQQSPLIPCCLVNLYPETGIVCLQFRKKLIPDNAPGLPGRDNRCIGARADQGGLLTVDADHLGQFTFFRDARHHGQRQLSGRAGSLDMLFGKFTQTFPPLLRVPHHDLDLFIAALYPLYLGPVETGPQLRADSCRRQPRSSTGRRNLNFKMPFAE